MIEEVQPGINDSETQQRIDDAKAGVERDEHGNVVRPRSEWAEPVYDAHDGLPGRPLGPEDTLCIQGYDPRAAKEPEPEKPRRVEAMTADGMLEAWYLYQSDGRLSRVRMGDGDDGAEGVDEGLAAALYVEETPGFRREIVLFAQQRRGEPDAWRHWYGNWPDNRRLAEAIYESFRAALAQRLTIQPFRILTTRTFKPDHLEQAAMANPNDLETRNKKWREDLTARKRLG